MTDLNVFQSAQQPECLQQVDHDCDHHHRVQNVFDIKVRGDLSAHEPKQQSDHIDIAGIGAPSVQLKRLLACR
jgi:hypothetical protein